MNKTIQSILFGSILSQCSVLMAMQPKNISEDMPYQCLVNYYDSTALEKLTKVVELDQEDKLKSIVKLPMIDNPFKEGLIKGTKVTVHPIDEEKFTLEKNGFEVLDLSGSSKFVAMLKEFYDLDYVSTTKLKQDELKIRYAKLLKAELYEWLKTKKNKSYQNAQWTPIQETAVAIRTTGPKLEGDKRQPALPLLHSDYPDSKEFRRYVNLREGVVNVNQEPKENGENYFVDYINIWAPTDESVGGTPLALIDRETIEQDDIEDAVVVPIIDGNLSPNDQFIGRSIKFEASRHKLYSVKNWTRGKVIVFYTFTTPHTAVLIKPEIPRNSVEIRGFISGTREK